jgi:hypothetical protein
MGPPVRDSQWDGQVIKMKKFEGDLKEYGSRASRTLSGLYYSHCEWKKMPRMIATLIKEGERLRKMGVYSGLPDVGDFEGISGDRCGSVREFFQEYLK